VGAVDCGTPVAERGSLNLAIPRGWLGGVELWACVETHYQRLDLSDITNRT
jgi:hypothetical protein